ncbi:MAG: DNA-processing protein DprA [Prevotella sp.]|nr:DNA-processing protein DprA [Prevotella sp.]
MNIQELTYWVTLALMPKMWTRRKNEIYVKCFSHTPKISIIELFENQSCWSELGMTDTETKIFKSAYSQLANNSFLVENMLSQGYEIFPIHSDDYPKILKDHLGMGSPTVIFTKGNKELFLEPSIAIVGSRNADEISLNFTKKVAKKASSDNKVVVSGFAKGVDRQALDSTLEAGGKSVIVLPQGIMTFASGFKQYYKYIAQGRVIVMSPFAPKAPWSVEFAMARNPIIYGMASEIYVAQSDNKGGTWSGVIDGLKKKRTIYVRCPGENEKNANLQLIDKGAIAVDINGCQIENLMDEKKQKQQEEKENLDERIISILSKEEEITSKNIILKLKIDWSDAEMKKHLETMPQVQKNKKSSRVFYCLKDKRTNDLFSY